MNYKIGICDDEESTCTQLENAIKNHFYKSGVGVNVYIWNSAEELMEDIPLIVNPDILFLDIELPGQNGINAAEYIRNKLNDEYMHIIYISSKTDYAMRLFMTHPYNFLVKPIHDEDVVSNVTRLLTFDENNKSFFIYEFNKKKYKINYCDILYFESNRKHINIISIDKKERIFVGKISRMAANLPPDFAQIAQSYIVNMRHIKEYESGSVTMNNGYVINIGRSYKDDFTLRIIEHDRDRRDGR